MAESGEPDATESASAAPASRVAAEMAARAPAPLSLLQRIHHHKLLQWTLAYTGAALAIAHAQELMASAYGWPHLVGRIVMTLLVLGLPLVLTLAWYHGHKGFKQIGAGEMTIIALLLVVVAGGFLLLVRPPEERGAAVTAKSQSASPAASAPEAPRTSIAVMPFANLTGDASKEYLGDGMAEEIINTLTKVPGFKVPARTSSFAYKGRSTDIRQIGKDLGVGTILEGSVRSAGERIRITAQLINARDGLHLWSETYDRKFTDIFKLQDELASAIVQALQGRMNPAVPATVTEARGTQDLEAYQLYLQARSIESRATEEALREALSLLDRAISRDPGFARAFAARAEIGILFLVEAYSFPHALENARRDAERAVALDARLPEALNVRGMIGTLRGDWAGAEADFRAALVAKPSDVDILQSYSDFLLQSAGHLRQGFAKTADSYALAPGDRTTAMELAVANSIMGIDGEATRLAQLAIEIGMPATVPPLPQVFANAAARSGRYQEAAERRIGALSEDLRKIGGAEVMRLVYAAYADASKKPAARQALRELVRRSGSRGLDGLSVKDFILDFTSLGALDDAYELANRALDEYARSGTVGSVWGMLWMPEMRSFRQDVRFQQFAGRLKLFDYWRQYGPPDDCDLRADTLVCR